MKKNIIIIILCLLVLCLTGYIVYDKVLKEDKPTNNVDNTETENNEIKYTEEDFNKIITNELYYLINKDSLSEITNQEMLQTIFKLYNEKQLNLNEIPISILDEIHMNSSLSKLGIIYEDVYDKSSNFDIYNETVRYRYDAVNNQYIDEPIGHGGNRVGVIIYKKLLTTEYNNNKYIVKYNFIFGNSYGDGPNPYEIYLSGKDAVAKENKYADIDYEDYTTYGENHYDEVKDKLHTYTYVFEEEDNHLVITDFSVE